jgi:hypothetical protein
MAIFIYGLGASEHIFQHISNHIPGATKLIFCFYSIFEPYCFRNQKLVFLLNKAFSSGDKTPDVIVKRISNFINEKKNSSFHTEKKPPGDAFHNFAFAVNSRLIAILQL